jgi:festuclavine dehydrogenase
MIFANTNAQIADLLSEVLGRKIVHKRLVPGEPRSEWAYFKVPEKFQKLLSDAEANVAEGGNELAKLKGQTDDIIVGKATVREFIEQNKAIWAQ